VSVSGRFYVSSYADATDTVARTLGVESGT
jgi:hypothetical protein